jgi:hypothetical protein
MSFSMSMMGRVMRMSEIIERRIKEIGCGKEELMKVMGIQEMVSDLFERTKNTKRCSELLRALAVKEREE